MLLFSVIFSVLTEHHRHYMVNVYDDKRLHVVNPLARDGLKKKTAADVLLRYAY